MQAHPVPRGARFSVHLSASEGRLLAICLGLLMVAILGPTVPQPQAYHHFADQRAWVGMPNALDVLSNLPFAGWGVLGLMAVSRWTTRAHSIGFARLAALFFVGLMVTALVSSVYHWRPDDAGLALDRGGMVLAFAGLLGLGTALQVSARAGWMLAAAVLLAGAISVVLWQATGNVLPWALLQACGMLWVVELTWLARRSPNPFLQIRWGCVLAWYALAKLLKLADQAVFVQTLGLVSGHSLKHLAASCAAWPVCAALWQAGRVAQCAACR